MKNIIKKWLGIYDLEEYMDEIAEDVCDLQWEQRYGEEYKKNIKKVAKKKK